MATHLENAKELKKKFDVKNAAEEFALAFKEDNDSVEAAGNAGLCYMMLGELKKASEFFKNALKINSSDELVALYISMIDVALGKEYVDPKMKNNDISVAEQFMTTAEMLFSIDMKEESFRLFEAILKDVNDDEWINLASNQYRIVAMLARFNFFDEATSIAQSLVDENPKAWQGYASLAQIELEKDNIVDAKAMFKQAILLGGDKEPLVVAAIADARLLKLEDKK